MTGNVAQVFLDDAVWHASLAAIHAAVRPGGHLAFESRNPGDRAWERWDRASTHARLATPDGPMERWLEVTHVGDGRVSYERHNVFLSTGAAVVAKDELRFRGLGDLTDTLTGAEFTVEHVYGDWEKGPLLSTSRVMIFVARRD